MRVAIDIFLLERKLTSVREMRNDVTLQVLAERRVQLAELNELISEHEAQAARNAPTPQPRKARRKPVMK